MQHARQSRLFCSVIAGHKARSIFRNQQRDTLRRFGVATKEDRSGFVHCEAIEITMEKSEWTKVRSKIIRRDAYRCRVIDCAVKGAKNMTVHHIVPRDEGGGYHDANLITLCRKHHDEIEIAGIRIIALIEAWEGDAQPATGTVSRIILDTVHGDGSKKRTAGTVVHLCDDRTVAAVIKIRNQTKRAWADIAKQLGYPASFAATLSAISKDKPGAISKGGEDELRERIASTSIDVLPEPERTALRAETWERKRADPANMRTCSAATIEDLNALDAAPLTPSWLRLAVYDALSRKPMSANRERRMRIALGLAPSHRKRYWRPCLPATLTQEQRAQIMAIAKE